MKQCDVYSDMNRSGHSLFHRVFHWRFLFLVNFCLIVLLGFTIGRDFLKDRELQKEIDRLRTQAEQLSARNVALSELQTAIQTQSYIEREARLKLGMKKPGEQVVVIQEEQPEMTVELSNDPADPLDLVLDEKHLSPRVSRPTKWWYYFFRPSAFKAIAAYEF